MEHPSGWQRSLPQKPGECSMSSITKHWGPFVPTLGRKKARSELDSTVKRARPHEWMKFINLKTAIQLVLLKEKGPPITEKLTSSIYRNDRSGMITFMDTSRLKIGKNSIQNRLKSACEFREDWLKGISSDALWIALKKHFIKGSQTWRLLY